MSMLCCVCLCACVQALDHQLAGEQGSKLDVYELEVANERGDALQDLAEFQLAAVSGKHWAMAGLLLFSLGVCTCSLCAVSCMYHSALAELHMSPS